MIAGRAGRSLDSKADREVAPVQEGDAVRGHVGQADGVAEYLLAGLDGEASLAAKGEPHAGAMHEVGLIVLQSNRSGAERHGLGAEHVREARADHLSPEVGLDDHAHGLVADPVRRCVGQREAEVGLRVISRDGGVLRGGRRRVGALDRRGPGCGPLLAATQAGAVGRCRVFGPRRGSGQTCQAGCQKRDDATAMTAPPPGAKSRTGRCWRKPLFVVSHSFSHRGILSFCLSLASPGTRPKGNSFVHGPYNAILSWSQSSPATRSCRCASPGTARWSART